MTVKRKMKKCVLQYWVKLLIMAGHDHIWASVDWTNRSSDYEGQDWWNCLPYQQQLQSSINRAYGTIGIISCAVSAVASTPAASLSISLSTHTHTHTHTRILV
jgi:hypothetical protein